MPATWHGQMGFTLAGFGLFIVSSVALSLVMTWVYRRTNRSILSGMLLHFTSNFTGQLLAPASDCIELVSTVLLLMLGIVMVYTIHE
jgi:membrane protease YdiL (CAAX protease family)